MSPSRAYPLDLDLSAISPTEPLTPAPAPSSTTDRPSAMPPGDMTTPAPQVDLETALNNVRRLSNSSLAHQKKPAQLLIALEQTLGSSLPSPFSGTAYFASLVQCLEAASAVGSTDVDDYSEAGLIPATLYLLALVIPETPRQVVANQLTGLLPTLIPLFDPSLAHPPALRSLVQIFTAIFLLSPVPLLNSNPQLKRAWNHFLELNVDPRPKVRHLAQEGVRKVLTTPIPPRVIPGAHPYLARARDWAMGVLQQETKGGSGASAAAGRTKKVKFAGGTILAGAEDAEGKRAIWVVQGLRGWVSVMNEEDLSTLCPLLLSLPPLPHLTPQIFSLLAHLLSPPPSYASGIPKDDQLPVRELANLPIILNSLLDSPPPSSAPTDQVQYIQALTSGMLKLSTQDAYLASKEYFQKAWTVLWGQILIAPTSAPEARRKAADGLGSHGLIRYCVSEEMVRQAVQYKKHGGDLESKRQKMKPPLLSKVLNQLERAMATQPLMLPFLLPVLTALISRLRSRASDDAGSSTDSNSTSTSNSNSNSKSNSPAQLLLLDSVVAVADLRQQPGFAEKEKVDDVVGMAFEVMGVEAVLKVLPLNIEPDASGKVPQPGRAHLLPLMRSRITNDSLSFFTTRLVPMSERSFERKVKAEEGNRPGEAKVWEVVIGQIWDCLPGFVDLARDLREGFNPQFASLLAQLLYSQPLLRGSILRALTNVITSVQTLSRSGSSPEELLAGFGVDQQDAAQSIAHLKGMAGEMLAVLFNVFSSLPREQRGQVGDVVGLWLSIMDEKEIAATYEKVTSHLAGALAQNAAAKGILPPVSHTMLDLLIILIPHLPAAPAKALFNAASTGNLIENSDAAIQKKSYRILTRLIESNKANALQGEGFDEFVQKLVDVSASIGPGAQRDRMLLLTTLVPILPKTRLHLIPTLVTEAVLGTKEVNEKARNAAFDLIIVMGKKMSEGGVVDQQLLKGEADAEEETKDGDEAMDGEKGPVVGNASATVEEYITMVAAGLAASTPHMISATITALSRLMFEYQNDLPRSMLDEMVATIVVFVGSKNREIVKSALGFVKVAVVSLPEGVLRPQLGTLVPALLGWVHDHKNHFKDKTVHIFERMIRKFGYDDIYRNSGEGDEKKVLEHIKKRKDRAKRQKIARAQNGDQEDDEADQRKTTGNAFDDALYGSASEESDDDEAKPAQSAKKGQQKARKGRENGAFIREDDDAPMDLLDRSIAGKVSGQNPAANKRRRPGQDAADFKTDKDTGRMIIDEDDDEGEKPTIGDALAGSAYQTALTSVDGMSRDARGRLKLNKATKRGRALEAENDVDMLEGILDDDTSAKKKAKRAPEKLGSEFRSKRAGGDVKPAGQNVSPYSYVPLGKATKQKGPNKVNLTNKKRGSRQ